MDVLPYIYIPPDVPMTPLVVSVPHAGTYVPPIDRPLVAASEKELLSDADLKVDRLYAHAPQIGAAMISARVSRYVVDLNRAPDDVDREVCPKFEPHAADNPRALIWRLTTDGNPVLARPLDPDELVSRLTRVHAPYHGKLAELLEERRRRFGYAILLDAHSMPSVGRVTHTDPGRRRADVVPGDNRGRSCSPALTDLVVRHFKAAGLSVALNDPYAGGWITRHYGQPADGVHAIQIELNRALYLFEEVPTWNGAYTPELIRVLDELMRALVAFDPRG